MGAKNFEVKLKKFRRAVNELKGMLQLNQKEIGQKLGYSSESAFSQVMNGKVPVSDAVIYRIIEMSKGAYSYEWFNSEGESITQNNIMGDNNIGSDETMKSLIRQNEKLIDELQAYGQRIDKLIDKITKQ